MSRYRKVDPKMWGDAKFRRLSHDAQRIWFYLLTGTETTSLPGVIVAGPGALAEGVGLSAEAFREAFREVLREGMAEADLEARFVWLPKACRYNVPESPNVVKSWRSHWDNAPECALKLKAYHALKAFAEGLGEAFGKAFAKAFGKSLPNQEQEQEQDLTLTRAREDLSPEASKIASAIRSEPALSVIRDPEALAEQVEGKRMSRGTSLDLVLEAVRDAARDVGARATTDHADSPPKVAETVARYCDKARPRPAHSQPSGPSQTPFHYTPRSTAIPEPKVRPGPVRGLPTGEPKAVSQ